VVAGIETIVWPFMQIRDKREADNYLVIGFLYLKTEATAWNLSSLGDVGKK